MFAPNIEEVEEFLTSFYHGKDRGPSSIARRAILIALHPVMTISAVQYIRKLPVIEVSVPESDRAKAHWLYDPRRPWKLNGFLSSYIELPSPLHTYWQGQAKQNLRKATARAMAAGFQVRAVETSEIAALIAQVWGTEDIEMIQRYLPDPLEGVICVAVFDERDNVVAFCTGTQAGNAVRAVWANTSQKGQVRWLCFSGFVEVAYARGVKFIIESPLWSIPGGNRLFASRLGYQAGRVRHELVSN